MDKLQPKYYQGADGLDLFSRFENGMLPTKEVVGFYKGNIIKYLTRYQDKNGVEDLQKAMMYLTQLITFESYNAKKKEFEHGRG